MKNDADQKQPTHPARADAPDSGDIEWPEDSGAPLGPLERGWTSPASRPLPNGK